jgi:hypothetical protein
MEPIRVEDWVRSETQWPVGSLRMLRRSVLASALLAWIAAGCSASGSASAEDNPCSPGRVGPTYLPDDKVTPCGCEDAEAGILTCSKGAAICFCSHDAGGDGWSGCGPRACRSTLSPPPSTRRVWRRSCE